MPAYGPVIALPVLPPNWTDAHAQAQGYADQAEAVADARANGFGPDEWRAYRSGPEVALWR